MIRPIIEEINTPHSPEDLFKALIVSANYPFFLDSGMAHGRLGAYSFLGSDPFLVFKSKRDLIQLEWKDGRREQFKSNPFLALKDIFKKYDVPARNPNPESRNPNKFPPFTSGGVGYFAYDLKSFIEDLPDTSLDDLMLPDCIFGFYDSVVICDNLNKKVYISSSGLPEMNLTKNRNRAKARLKEFKNKILEGRDGKARKDRNLLPCRLRSNFSKASYIEAIERAKHYIKKGDIYQVNLSQRFETELNEDPIELYLRLRAYCPAPFSAYLDFKDVKILSSSPERFLMKRGRYVETRPIKGTRPRGEDAPSDAALERELVNSQKDRAEHIMIVDLERNDLGRICEFGSVRPTEVFVLEKYSNVFHLVSTVAGRLKKGMGPVDCLMAAFPGGSITGAPKIRSMEIIEEIEPVKRSIYTGAIGYISFDGEMDTCIVIRTFVVKDRKAYFSVGGGIVADSDPEAEYEETLYKAQGLMRSLGLEFHAGLAKRELVSI